MSGVLELVREDLRDFAGYASARSVTAAGPLRLDANESAWSSVADPAGSCVRYPDPQPDALVQALAALYGCGPERLVVGRGSDEAIDLLVRALCRPGRDAVAITPPVFGMYAVAARLHAARLLEVPLVEIAGGFEVEFDRLAQVALEGGARLVFLCSPGNPTGNALALERVAMLADALQGRALVVVDEAYAEFSRAPSAAALLDAHANIAVLRTLSKAHALAGARIGTVIADPGLARVLRRCQAPYPVPAPCADLAVAALQLDVLARTARQIATVRAERARMATRLAALGCVTRVYPSEGNFLLVRFSDAGAAFERLLHAGIVVRDQRAAPSLGDALRITIGTPEQNDRVLQALGAPAMEAP
ncbi:MAG: histidinol-phosphate transaminase [Gammaproteobacteria bacterium]|nr:histidinol-phosphate transaminase [Gammaproteobacteria bacterium]